MDFSGLRSVISEIGVPLFVIFAFTNVPTLLGLFTRNSHQLPKRPITKYDQYTSYLLLLCSATCLGLIVYPFENIYRRLNVDSDSISSYLIRNCPAHEMALCQLLENRDSKLLYSLHGGELVKCHWCTTSLDFFISSLPSHLISYTIFLGIIGAATMNWRRNSYRFQICLLTILVAGFDFSSRLTYDLVASIPLQETVHSFLLRSRFLYFAIAFAVLFATGNGDKWSDEELLKKILERNTFNSRANLIYEAIVQLSFIDESIRSKIVASYVRPESEKLNAVHEEIRRSPKTDEVIQRVLELTNSMLPESSVSNSKIIPWK